MGHSHTVNLPVIFDCVDTLANLHIAWLETSIRQMSKNFQLSNISNLNCSLMERLLSSFCISAYYPSP